MKLIKILVSEQHEADKITKVLTNAEEWGEIDFPFTLRISEDLNDKVAVDNLYREVH